MGDDLYFIEQPEGAVFVYSPFETGKWKMSRLGACQKKKLIWVVHYMPEKNSWALQDQSPSSKNQVMGMPEPAEGESPAQTLDRPPLGRWRVGGYRFQVTNQLPWTAPLNALQTKVEVPFATVKYTESGNIGRLDTKMNSTAVTDEALEDLLKKITRIVQNLSQRPTMVLILHSDAQDSAVPSFKQIRRFLDWIQENGPELFLVGRGSAIILKPSGILGHTLVGIIRMVQKMLPPPWPEAIVSSAEEAEGFLEEHSQPYKGPFTGGSDPSAVPSPVRTPQSSSSSQAEGAKPACPDQPGQLQPSSTLSEAPTAAVPDPIRDEQALIPEEPKLKAPMVFEAGSAKASALSCSTKTPEAARSSATSAEKSPVRGLLDFLCCGAKSADVSETGFSAPRASSRVLDEAPGGDEILKQSI